jgi:hypothetical protein
MLIMLLSQVADLVVEADFLVLIFLAVEVVLVDIEPVLDLV